MTSFGAARIWQALGPRSARLWQALGPRSARLWLALGLAVVLGYTTSFVGLSSPNERSRLYLTVALFEQHCFAIDQVRAHLGAVLDEATFGGHYFTDKAPGASVLALVPYAALRLFVGARDVTIPMLLGIGRYAVMVPLGVVAFFAFEALCSTMGIGRSAARFTSLAYLLGTPTFHYSAAFFGHQIVSTALLVALWLIVRQQALADKPAAVQLLLAGFLTGIAGITEYQALIGVVGLSACVMVTSKGRRLRALLCFAIGGLPLALWLAHYHAACFGGPLELSYHHLSHPQLAEVHRQGIGGVGWPTIEGLQGSLFSLHRGLFATSPFLLLSLWGFGGLWRRGYAALASCLALTSLTYLAFVAASATWEAGWGYGCRLLIPALPILSLFVAMALERARGSTWLWGVMGSAVLASVVAYQAVTLLFAEPPNELHNPWLDVVVPLASQALFAPNIGSRLLGLRGYYSVLPLLLLLCVLLGSAVRVVARSQRSRTWLAFIPVAPILGLLIVNAQGPSGTLKQRSDFVAFARSLYAGALSSRGR